MYDDQFTLPELKRIEAALEDHASADDKVGWEEAVSAAEYLLDSPELHDETTLHRVLRLLDHAATFDEAGRFGISWFRARAFVGLQLVSQISRTEAMEAVLEALSLSRDYRDDFRIYLGLAAANFFWLLKDPEVERRHVRAVHEAASYSHDVFASSNDPRLDGSTRFLAHVKLRLIELDEPAPAELARIHAEAHALAESALAGAEAQSSLIVRGICHELAGSIAAADPAGPSQIRLASAITHLRAAYRCYLEVDPAEPPHAEIQRCLFKILELQQGLLELASIAAVTDFERDLHVLEWSVTGSTDDALRFPSSMVEAAKAWLAAAHQSDGEAAEAAFAKAAARARQFAAAGASKASLDRQIDASFVLGNALGARFLTAGTLERLPQSEVDDVRRRLTEAADAFREALRLVDQRGGSPMAARVCAQLAKALSARLACCGDLDCLDPARRAWRDAIHHADPGDRIRYQFNLVQLILAHIDEVPGAEIDEALELLARIDDTPGAREIAERIPMLRAFLDEFSGHAEGPSAAFDYQRAVRLARDQKARRQYLREALTSLPDYNPLRSAFLSSTYATVRAELLQLGLSGLAERDPTQWQALQRQADNVRITTEELIANDRRDNDAGPAKALIASAMEERAPFLLVLRSFSLESRFVDAPQPDRGELAEVLGPVDARARTLAVSGDRAARRLLERISADCSPLLVMNVQDPIPPKASAKLFAAPSDWRRLVFALAMEAKAVLVFLSASEPMTAGLADELRALVELDSAGKAAVVIEPSLRSLFETLVEPDAETVERTRADLLARGFPIVISEHDAETDFDGMVAKLKVFIAARLACSDTHGCAPR